VTTHLAREFIHKRDRPAREVADATVAFVLDGLLAGVDERTDAAGTITGVRPAG
jgi:hypothetical protein